jgi:hypothetical protein
MLFTSIALSVIALITSTLPNYIPTKPLLNPLIAEAVKPTPSPTPHTPQVLSATTQPKESTPMPSTPPAVPLSTPPTATSLLTPSPSTPPPVSSAPTATPTNTPKATKKPTPHPTTTPLPISTAPKTPKPTAHSEPKATPLIITSNELETLFTKYADEYKIDKNQLKKIAQCESGFNPNSKTSLYVGMFQFSESSWDSNRKSMGQNPDATLRSSPEESIKTAAYMLSKGKQNAWPNCK